LTTDNLCFYLQNRLIQTSQTGGQWYSDTPPLVFPVRSQYFDALLLRRAFTSRRFYFDALLPKLFMKCDITSTRKFVILEVLTQPDGVITSTKYEYATVPQLVLISVEVMSQVYT
jgi:hypothetical protein